MSVKNKVKRLNRELERLNQEIIKLNKANKTLENKGFRDKELFENIIKFAITNQVGGIRGGMRIERYGIDKMKDLHLSIDYEPMTNSYLLKTNYY